MLSQGYVIEFTEEPPKDSWTNAQRDSTKALVMKSLILELNLVIDLVPTGKFFQGLYMHVFLVQKSSKVLSPPKPQDAKSISRVQKISDGFHFLSKPPEPRVLNGINGFIGCIQGREKGETPAAQSAPNLVCHRPQECSKRLWLKRWYLCAYKAFYPIRHFSDWTTCCFLL